MLWLNFCLLSPYPDEKVCALYESALQKDPNNEEHLSHLFMAYVRVCSYKKQQSTALALYKVKPKNPYYFWAVMSVVMQSYGADENARRNVLLPFAERMIRKFINEKRIESDAESFLFLTVLELQVSYVRAWTMDTKMRRFLAGYGLMGRPSCHLIYFIS